MSMSRIFYAPENNSTKSFQEVRSILLYCQYTAISSLEYRLSNWIIVKEALARGKRQHIVHCDWFEISAVNNKEGARERFLHEKYPCQTKCSKERISSNRKGEERRRKGCQYK